jgi:hypothetical protein
MGRQLPEEAKRPGKISLVDRALILGGAAWLAAVGACMYLNDERVTRVLMPLWVPVASLAGSGPNLGTPARPMYEATPVHALAGLTGIALSAVVYIGLVYALLRWAWKGSAHV